jgi:hypothetical protein
VRRSSARTSATPTRPYAQARATDKRPRGRSDTRRTPRVDADDLIVVRVPDHRPELNAHASRLLLAMLVELATVGVSDVDREDRADVAEH